MNTFLTLIFTVFAAFYSANPLTLSVENQVEQENFDVKDFMKETIQAFDKNKNSETHIAYARYAERAIKDDENIMFMESMGYAIHMKRQFNQAAYSNYKFLYENTRLYVDNPVWKSYANNTSMADNVIPSGGAIPRTFRIIEENGLLNPKNFNHYTFDLSSTYECDSENIYIVTFSGGGDEGEMHVNSLNNNIVKVDFKTKSYFSNPFHDRVEANVILEFSYLNSTPYLSSGNSIYEKNGLVHYNEFYVIEQKDVEIELNEELYWEVNSYDHRPFINYNPGQWEGVEDSHMTTSKFQNLPSIDLSVLEKAFADASGKWFPLRNSYDNTAKLELIQSIIASAEQ